MLGLELVASLEPAVPGGDLRIAHLLDACSPERMEDLLSSRLDAGPVEQALMYWLALLLGSERRMSSGKRNPSRRPAAHSVKPISRRKSCRTKKVVLAS